jgi:hypothetical protein
MDCRFVHGLRELGWTRRERPSGPLKLPHCGLMPAIFTTLSHFAASEAI